MKKLLSTFVLSLTMILLLTSCDLFSGNIGDAIVNFHSYGEWTVTAKPTCSKDGEKVRYCSCGDKETAIIPALAHTPGKAAIEDRVEPTYGSDGSYNEVVRCSVCNEKLSETHHVIPKPKHTPGDAVKENVLEATCYREGSYDIVTYCSECNQELERISHILPMTEHIPALAVEENRVEPTHENDGSYQMVVYCSVAECHKELERTTHTLDMLVHHPGDVVIENVIEATCTKNGSYDEAVYCLDKDCGHKELSRKTVITDIIPHTNKAAVEENRSDATCYSEGKYDSVVYCAVCTTEISRTTVTLEKTAHSPAPAVIENKVNATCTTDGSYDEVVYCSVENCKAQISKTAKILTSTGHTEAIDEPVAPTCTATGLTEGKHCSVCNVILVAQDTVAALGHTEVIDNAVTPTCTETGLTEGKHCSVCRETLQAQTVLNAKGHNYVNEICTTCYEYTLTPGLYDEYYNLVYSWDELVSNGFDIEAYYTTEASWSDPGTLINNSNAEDVDANYTLIISNEVEKIGSYSIAYCEGIQTVIIPKSVKSIDSGAFYYCTSLKNVYIQLDAEISISDPFPSCYSLTNIFVPDNIVSFELSDDYPSLQYNQYDNAYYLGNKNNPYIVLVEAIETSITSCEINENTKIIHQHAFSDCKKLESIDISKNVTSIGGYAFNNCSSLVSVIIPDSVTFIGDYAFRYCSGLSSIIVDENNQKYKSTDGSLYTKDGKTLILYAAGNPNTSYIIPDSVTSICVYAFYNCTSLTSVVIPDGVTRINYSTFEGCTSLTSIVIPDSVTYIGGWAFNNCKKLSVVYYKGDEDKWDTISISSGNGYLKESVHYYSETAPTAEGNFWHYVDSEPTVWQEYVAPAYSEGLKYASNGDGTCSLTEIGTCTDTDIVIPSEYNGMIVTSIEESAFENIDTINSVTIPNGVKEIKPSAFMNCTSLTSVIIPDSVEIIGSGAFNSCELLNSLKLPSNLTFIGSSAFGSCVNLKSVIFPNGNHEIEVRMLAFAYCLELADIEFGTCSFVFDDYVFENCKSLKNITIPSGVKTIGAHMFSGADNLESVIIKEGVTHIDSLAFYNCVKLFEISMPSSIIEIGDRAFCGCSSLNTITIPDSVTFIHAGAFHQCNSLTNAIFSDPNNWTRGKWGAEVNPILSTELSDYTTAATYLKSTYSWDYWKHTVS